MKKSKSRIKTWNDVKTFDDIITNKERRIIINIVKNAKPEERCDELGREGKFFYYCIHDYVPTMDDRKPSPESGIYQRKRNCLELNNYCLGGCARCKPYRDSQKT